jgi:uncharacterized membrane protein YhaH (DUF805 family)
LLRLKKGEFMFAWTGVLDPAAYARRAAIAIAFLVGTILLSPYLSTAIVSVSNCYSACGVVTLIAPTIFRPILFVAAIAMALSACVRRTRDAGLRPWLGAFPPLMLVGDEAFLQYAGMGPNYPLSMGALAVNPPVWALFGTVVMALLGVPSRDALRNGGSRLLDRSLLILATLLSVSAVLRTAIVPVTFVPFQVLHVEIMLASYAVYTMPVFLVLAAYRVWPPHPAATATPSPYAVPVSETPNFWQPRRAALIGLMIAFAVLLWTLLSTSLMPVPMVLMALVGNLLLLYVPTFLIYTALVAAVLRLMARRDAIATTALFVALIPFGLWAASLSSVMMAKAREREAIAAIPKVALPSKAGVVVIEGEEGALINCARRSILSADRGVGDVLTHGRRGPQSWGPYLRFTQTTANSPVNKGVVADGVPAEYVLIRVREQSPFSRDSVPLDNHSPPVEIYAVGSGGTQLVAARDTARNPPPTFPPMLTTYGWYRGENSTTSEETCRSVADFLRRELLNKLQPGRS